MPFSPLKARYLVNGIFQTPNFIYSTRVIVALETHGEDIASYIKEVFAPAN